MLIFDGDYPMAFGAIEINRDLTLPLEEVRAAEKDSEVVAMASLPELRRARIAAALVKFTVRRLRRSSIAPGYRGGEAACAAARGQAAYYHVLAQRGEAAILTTGQALAQHMARWEGHDQPETLPVGFILGMEGADPILWPDQVHEWWNDGVRVVSLTHYGPSTYAWGTGTRGGLKEAAPGLLKEMESCGMLLDLTHTADESFWEALEIYSGPVLASHQNCRALAPGVRQFSDEQLRAVIERGGVVGASMDTWMLDPGGRLDWSNSGSFSRRDHFRREDITLAHVADHIDHVCQLAGNSHHAAIGGDTDGQGGVEGAPWEVDTVADYQKVVPILLDRGYSEEDAANVMYRNWQRFYEKWLP